MKKIKKYDKFRTFMIEIYPDDDNYLGYLNYIIDYKFKNKKYSYLGITHDKDINDDGSLKKAHDHIVLYFENPRSLNSLSNELGLPSQYIEIYSDLKKALTYLIHLNDGDKYQYSIDETFGNLQEQLKKYCKNNVLSEEDRVCLLLDLIDGYYKYTSYSVFLRDVCKNGLYDILRRNNFMFIKIFDKHNEKFINYNN